MDPCQVERFGTDLFFGGVLIQFPGRHPNRDREGATIARWNFREYAEYSTDVPLVRCSTSMRVLGRLLTCAARISPRK